MIAGESIDPVLDDAGLLRLLKLPEATDLDYYRRNQALPYVRLRVGGQDQYRYLTQEVLKWLTSKQRPSRTHTGAVV